MSRLDELIKELCPNGVEYKPLEAFLKIKNGSDYKAFGEGEIPVYGSGGVMTYIDRAIYDKPTVLIPRKGSIDKLYYVDTPFWNVDTIFYTEINTELAIPRYVYHCLARAHLEQYNTAGGVPSLTQKVLNGIEIPLPPLPVQEEIVRILDTFTELEAELEAELDARKKQYEFYRDKLLTFGDFIQRFPICEVCVVSSGSFVKSDKQRPDAPYPVFNGGTTNTGLYDEYNFSKNKVIMSSRGANAGFVNRVFEHFWAGNSCYVFDADNFKLNWNYLYYILKKEQNSFISSQQTGSIPAVSKKQVENYIIPVPPLEEQERIVSILDRFDTLCNDISQGLPKEIELRHKQYEYYRDKLLTFPRKEA